MAERLPTIQEVQQLVDDPKIDDETKRTLLVRYFDAIDNVDPAVYGFQNGNDKKRLLDAYQDRFGFDAGDLKDGAYAYDAYSAAQGQHDANLSAAREDEKRAVDAGKARLDSLKGSDTSAGAGNSNEILDTGVAGLDSFRNWLPVYRKARAIVAPNLPDYRFAQDIVERYDEQRDIPFAKFAAGAGEIVAVRESVADAAPTQNQAMQNLFGQWEGDGKNAAAQSWTKFGDGVRTVEQTLEHAADVINRAVAAIAGSCRDKAAWVLRYAFQTWPKEAGLTAQEMDRLARIAELGRNASADDFKHFTGFLLKQNPALAQQLIVGSSFGLSDELLDAVQAWAKQYLAGFCSWFAGMVGEFQTMCENTRVAVASQWAALNTELQKVPDNPFAAVGEAAPVAVARGGSGGSGSGGGSAGGGGAAGGGGGAPAAAPVAPAAAPVPPAVVPPVTAPDAGERDTLTVQRGDSRIEMSEPDQDGRMGIKIDTGPGEAKDYQLTWGTTDPAQPAYAPGADGKIHIDDGALHITAERPQGETGPTVVTIDDGTGTPTTYTLGEERTAGGEFGAAGRLGAGQAGFASGGLGAQAAGADGEFGSAGQPGLAGQSADFGGAGVLGGAQPPGGEFGSAGQPGLAGESADSGAGALGGAQSTSAGREFGSIGQPGVAGQVADFGGAGERGGAHPAGAGEFGSAGQPGLAGQSADPAALGGAAGTEFGSVGRSIDSDQAQRSGDLGVESTVPAQAVGGVAEGLSTEGALSGSLGDPASLDQPVPAAAGATLGTAPGDQVGMIGGGLPATGGAQGGDEPERTSRAYRVDGDIFETAGSVGRISGSLDDEETGR